MSCYKCHQPTGPSDYLCDACGEEARRRETELEEQARSIVCPDCGQPKGHACLTGSGQLRNWAHAKRQKAAKRYIRNTRGNKR